MRHVKGAIVGMAEQSTIQVGNAMISLASTNDPFSDGRTTGYLECYDERHQAAFPLTSHAVCGSLVAIVHEPSMPAHRIAGRITGRMEALMENGPQTFKSFVLAERITTLQAL